MEMKMLKHMAEKKINKEINEITTNHYKKKVKARPSVMKRKEVEEKKKKEVQFKNPKDKKLHGWIDKLENMHTILTAEEGMCKSLHKN